MAESPWPTIHAERGALADDLTGLTPQQWATPSLCSDWTVHQALAHQVATARMSPAGFLGKIAAAGFNFLRMSAKDVAAQSGGGPVRTLEAFRSVQSATTSPPRPKELPWVTRAIEFYARSNAIVGGKRRVDGLTLKATGTDWSRGSGPLVQGRALSLLLATTGRSIALNELAGPGLDALRSR